METSTQGKVSGGLWNSSRAPQYSKETQDMLRLMMQESKVTNFQRRKINECLKNGAALPLTFDPAPLDYTPQPELKTHKHTLNRLPAKPQKRSAESCRSGNSYVREKFRPLPTRDLDKEKRRLQNILATGQAEPTVTLSRNVHRDQKTEAAEKDRYQEVLDEIEDRRQFLVDMAALGQDKHYFHVINTEISQKIRELEVMDRARSAETKDGGTSERKVVNADHKMENRDSEETGAEKTD
ncbi:hypothetical protein LDENG_00051230 [Lucifuga dentata]|nr:hypothetical protein LDENG_00051230 [Lucifuga dentata]